MCEGHRPALNHEDEIFSEKVPMNFNVPLAMTP